MTWDEYTRTPEFQALTPAEQADHRQAWLKTGDPTQGTSHKWDWVGKAAEIAALGTIAAPLAGAAFGGGAAATGGGGAAATGGGIGGVIKSVAASNWLAPVLGVGGQIVGDVLQANANKAGQAAQQKYLEEALAYQKQSDAYARQQQQYNTITNANRYAALQANLAPYRASGVSANTRMSDLLGLPPGAAQSPAPPTYATPTLPTFAGDPNAPQALQQAQLANRYRLLGGGA